MKKAKKSTYAVIASLLVLWGCRKSDNLTVCGTDEVPSYVSFRILDKATNSDLFFTQAPMYQPDQLKIAYKGKVVIPSVVMSQSLGSYFRIYVSGPARTDTCYLKIADQPADTLIFNIRQGLYGTCQQLEVNKIVFNGDVTNDANTRILILKR